MVTGSNREDIRHLEPQGACNFTEFVPQCRGIGHLRYQGTSPRTFGKLTNWIIRVEGQCFAARSVVIYGWLPRIFAIPLQS